MAEVEISGRYKDGRPWNRNEELARLILEAKFPDMLAKHPGRITPNAFMAPQGMYTVRSESAPEDEGRIRYRAPSDAPGNSADQGFTTPNVMQTVGTILHELYHSQQHQGEKNGAVKDDMFNGGMREYKANSNWRAYRDDRSKALDKAYELKFPSQADRSKTFYNNNEEELMATLVPEMLAQERGLGPLDYRKEVDALQAFDPNVEDWAKRNKYPDVRSLKDPGPVAAGGANPLRMGRNALLRAMEYIQGK